MIYMSLQYTFKSSPPHTEAGSLETYKGNGSLGMGLEKVGGISGEEENGGLRVRFTAGRVL
jgi:hypothetical protein